MKTLIQKIILLLFVSSIILSINSCKKPDVDPALLPRLKVSDFSINDSIFQSGSDMNLTFQVANSNLLEKDAYIDLVYIYTISDDTIISDDDYSGSSSVSIGTNSVATGYASLPDTNVNVNKYLIIQAYLRSNYAHTPVSKKIIKFKIKGFDIDYTLSGIEKDSLFSVKNTTWNLNIKNTPNVKGTAKFTYYVSDDSIISSNDLVINSKEYTTKDSINHLIDYNFNFNVAKDKSYYIITTGTYKPDYSPQITLKTKKYKRFRLKEFKFLDVNVQNPNLLSSNDSVHIDINYQLLQYATYQCFDVSIIDSLGKSCFTMRKYISKDLGANKMNFSFLMPKLNALNKYSFVVSLNDYANSYFEDKRIQFHLNPQSNLIKYNSFTTQYDEYALEETIDINHSFEYLGNKASNMKITYFLSNDSIISSDDRTITTTSSQTINPGINTFTKQLVIFLYADENLGNYNILMKYQEDVYAETEQMQLGKTLSIIDNDPIYENIYFSDSIFSTTSTNQITWEANVKARKYIRYPCSVYFVSDTGNIRKDIYLRRDFNPNLSLGFNKGTYIYYYNTIFGEKGTFYLAIRTQRGVWYYSKNTITIPQT